MKKMIFLFLMLSLPLVMTGCGYDNASSVETNRSTEKGQEQNDNTSQSRGITNSDTTLDTSDMFTSYDKEIGYDESNATQIILSSESVTITKEGTYILSGELTDGQIIIAVDDTKKVHLVLNHAKISSSNSAPIYVKSADKVFITLAAGSENILSVIGEYANDGENNVDGAVFSKSDLTFNGTGLLTINTAFGNGIVGKDDVVFTSGTYHITAENHGISANDSVRIADGTFTITCGKDGIQAEHDEDEAKGFIYIVNGDFTVNAQDDGFSASGAVQIEDGNFSIPYCYEGIEGISVTINGGTFDITSSDDGINAASGSNNLDYDGSHDPFSTTEGAFITINGGIITIVSDGDSIDSNGSLTINGGTLLLTCNGNGNSAIDTSGTYTHNGGEVTTNDGSESKTPMDGKPNGGGQRPDKSEPPANIDW